MKIAFYTANVKGYDRIFNNAQLHTDAPIDGNARLKSRWIKLHPHILHPNVDYWVYIDANLKLEITLKELVDKYGGDFISARRHPTRDCIYDEIKEVARLEFDSPENLRKVANKLLDDDFPEHFGLWEHGLLIIKNTPETIEFLEDWYEFLLEHSRRDQLSGAYMLWKNNKVFKDIPRSVLSYQAHAKYRKEGGF